MLEWIWGKPKEGRFSSEKCQQARRYGWCCCTCRWQLRSMPFPRHSGEKGWCCISDARKGVVHLKDTRHGFCDRYQQRRPSEEQVSFYDDAICF